MCQQVPPASWTQAQSLAAVECEERRLTQHLPTRRRWHSIPPLVARYSCGCAVPLAFRHVVGDADTACPNCMHGELLGILESAA